MDLNADQAFLYVFVALAFFAVLIIWRRFYV